MSRFIDHIIVLLIASTCVAKVSTTRMGLCPDYRTGKRASYNPATEVCCSGRVYTSDPNTRTLCCGEQTYKPHSQICCGGEVRQRSDTNKCCDFRLWYNSSSELCCGGHLESNPYGLSKCCGSVAYNTKEKTCCPIESERSQGVERMAIVHGLGQCCGNAVINPAQQLCCNGEPLQRDTGFSECCGNTTFDIRTEGCCGNKTPFNTNTKNCCNGNVHSKDNGATCCGTKSYSPSESSCCHDNVFRGIPEVANVQACCGGVSYSKTSQLCCQGTIFERGEDVECCGDNTYNTSSELCCGFGDEFDVVHHKTTPADRCCGASTYDPTSQTCCEAVSRSFDLVGGQCCFTSPEEPVAYDPARQTCCKGFNGETLYQDTPTNQSSCCGTYLMADDELCNPMDNFPVTKRAFDDNTICFTSSMISTATYNSQTQICLEDGRVEYYSETVDVCHNLLYDPTAEICCEGLIRGRFNEDGHERACCVGTTNSFTPDQQTCCYGNIHEIPTTQSRCCRTKAYDPSTHICDDSGFVRSMLSVAAKPELCNHTPYNPEVHTCCGGLLIPAGKYCCMGFQVLPPPGIEEGGLCCGYNIYDPDSHVCCGDTVYSQQGSESSCCGSRLLIDPVSQICCDSTLHSRTHGRNHCDGYTAYNPETETVCDGSLYSVPNGRCCGGRAYDEDTELCCNGLVHIKTSNTHECCGRVTYDSTDSTILCCNGHWNRAEHDGQVCCGDTTIDSRTKTCCSNDEFPSFVLPRLAESTSQHMSCCDPSTYDNQHSPHTCCGGVEHKFVSNGECCGQNVIRNPEEEICCGGAVVSRFYGEHTECCDSLLIDDREQTCCNNRILIPGGFEQCCGSNIVNTLYQTCCGEEVFRTTTDTGCCDGTRFATGRQGCCGASLYDLSTEECADSGIVLLNRPEKRVDVHAPTSICDDQEDFDTSEGNFVSFSDTETEKTACCHGRRYNPVNFDCCNGTLHHRVNGSQCCGSSYFNPTKESCCDDKSVVSTLRGERCPDSFDLILDEPTDSQASQCLCTMYPRGRELSSACVRGIKDKRHIFIGVVVDAGNAGDVERRTCRPGSGNPCRPSRLSIALRGRLPSTLEGDDPTADVTLSVLTSRGIECEAPRIRNGQKVVIFSDHRVGPDDFELSLGRDDVVLLFTRKLSRNLRNLSNAFDHI